MPYSHRTAAVAVATATAAALLGLAGPAAADSGSPAPVPSTDGAKALCHRATKIDRRIDRALTRLNGPVTTRGSIARLQQRVDNAKAAGHTEVETYLKDRLTFRKSLVPTLQQRREDLAEVQDWCEANDNGATT
jgi:hypothetical protein